jgi:hypothetical protein
MKTRDLIRHAVGNPFLADRVCDHILWEFTPHPCSGPEDTATAAYLHRRFLAPAFRDLGMPGKDATRRTCYRLWLDDEQLARARDGYAVLLSHVSAQECSFSDLEKGDIFVLHDSGKHIWERVVTQHENGTEVCRAIEDANFDPKRPRGGVGDCRWEVRCDIIGRLDRPIAWDALWHEYEASRQVNGAVPMMVDVEG